MDKSFQSEVAKIAIPVALQSMLQSSFSMIDQIMVGQLGEKSIAAVEIAAKPSFIYAFVIGAVGTIAGIMISQYIGKKISRQKRNQFVLIHLSCLSWAYYSWQYQAFLPDPLSHFLLRIVLSSLKEHIIFSS